MSTLPTNQEDQETYLREHGAANLINAVDAAVRDRTVLLLTVDGFYQEPEVLYVALDYASSMGADVRIVPLAA